MCIRGWERHDKFRGCQKPRSAEDVARRQDIAHARYMSAVQMCSCTYLLRDFRGVQGLRREDKIKAASIISLENNQKNVKGRAIASEEGTGTPRE